MDRIKTLKEKAFRDKSFDGFLVFNYANLLYLTGVPGTSSLLISNDEKPTLYVYGVNFDEAKAETKNCNVEPMKRGQDLMAKIAQEARSLRIKKLGIDVISEEGYRALAKPLRGKTKLKIQGNLIWEMRKIKDPQETELMRKAGEITSFGMKAASEAIRPGVKETEVAAEIEYAMRMKGGWGTAFETSVASGPRSAYPHGGCAENMIKRGELVVVDIGAKYKHYCSDMTRTFVAGTPTQKQVKLYDIVKLAHEKAFEAMMVRSKATDVDGVARKVIADAEYGERFVHGLGHGVGLEVHEPPTLSPGSKDKLTVGNVVTDEPGIYLLNWGGIRIEDSVLVTKNKPEKLTKGPYALQTAK